MVRHSVGEWEWWPVWPYWAIYWTLGIFLKPFAAINWPKSSTFLGNFCKDVKICHFSSEIIFWATFIDIWRFFSGHSGGGQCRSVKTCTNVVSVWLDWAIFESSWWQILWQKFVTNWWLFGVFWGRSLFWAFYVKTPVNTFRQRLENNLATLYSIIWSQCSVFTTDTHYKCPIFTLIDFKVTWIGRAAHICHPSFGGLIIFQHLAIHSYGKH